MSTLSLASSGSIATQTSDMDVKTRTADYKPSIWSYEFLQSLQEELYEDERWTSLEEDVKYMIDYDNDAKSVKSTLELIDDIQRLGLGHRFEASITGALDRIMKNLDQITDEDTPSLHLTALRFRLLRQHGFQVSQELGGDVESIKSKVKALKMGKSSNVKVEIQSKKARELYYTYQLNI